MSLRRRFSPAVIFGTIVLILGILWVAGGLSLIQYGVRSALLPVARVFARIGFQVDQRRQTGQSVESLQSKVQELESKISGIAVDYVRLKALEEENTSLKNIAGFLTDNRYDHISAQVIARSVDSHRAEIVIDRGSLDGIENGMAVIAENGVFVGKVISIRERISTVLLTTDERTRLAAAVAGVGHLAGMVQGQGNGVAKMTLIPQSEAMAPNMVIVTAGTEEKIPANLTIGLVDHVDATPTDPFKTALLQPLVQMHRLNIVVVLRPVALRPGTK